MAARQTPQTPKTLGKLPASAFGTLELERLAKLDEGMPLPQFLASRAKNNAP